MRVREVAERFEPWRLYRMHGDDGQPLKRVELAAFDELLDGTVGVQVRVRERWNPNETIFERLVFGVNPGRLTECDLPALPGPP